MTILKGKTGVRGTGYLNVTNVSEAKIGDVITFGMSYPEFEHYMWLEAKRDGVTKEAFKEYYENNVKHSGAHYSIVLLKTKDGMSIQTTIQKSGTNPVEISGYPGQSPSQNEESGEDMFVPSPINEGDKTPIYRKKDE